MKPSPKVLILALDAAEPDLLLRWAADGKLRSTKRLLSLGAFSKTENPPGLSGAVWPTLITGVTAARHGRYCFSQLRPGSYRTRLMSSRDVAFPPFWQTLSDAGKRVAVIDVPKTFPIENLNGLQICDWGNHDGDIIDGFQTWPGELRRALDRRYGRDPFGRRSFGVRGPNDLGEFVRGLCANIERKSRLALDLMDQEPWDLLFVSWDDAHWAGHFGWRLHDQAHPDYDAGLAEELGDPLELVLTALDRCIGEILDRAGPEVMVLLLSSHGMGPGYHTCELVQPILLSLLQMRTLQGSAHGKLRVLWDKLPRQAHRILARAKNRLRENLLEKDRARRPYFAVPSNTDGGSIRLNLIGRERQGKIRPGVEYDSLCQWLIDELKDVVDADTGEPIVREAYKLRDRMRGGLQDLLPDLSIEWTSGSPVRRISSPKIGEIAVSRSPWRSGEHLRQGLLLSAGPGVSAGPIEASVRAQDFAPTVGRLLGVPMPGLDGAPIGEMVPGAP